MNFSKFRYVSATAFVQLRSRIDDSVITLVNKASVDKSHSKLSRQFDRLLNPGWKKDWKPGHSVCAPCLLLACFPQMCPYKRDPSHTYTWIRHAYEFDSLIHQYTTYVEVSMCIIQLATQKQELPCTIHVNFIVAPIEIIDVFILLHATIYSVNSISIPAPPLPK